ncbi:MAG: DUF3291 domain-containing protein [Owenweeksia sp.]|nr:DUF3291 domain-containing protein [Owenweeksia sp.]
MSFLAKSFHHISAAPNQGEGLSLTIASDIGEDQLFFRLRGGIYNHHFFRFKGFSHCWWAFTQMQFARGALRRVKGVTFTKLMGSGSQGGFSWLPNFRVYCLLICWEKEIDYQQVYANSNKWFQRYTQRSSENFSMQLRAYQQHGAWGGRDPFVNQEAEPPGHNQVAVITRAYIRASKLRSFWKLVPRISYRLGGMSGLKFTKGVGEWPLIELTTISIWQNEEKMRAFAYGTPGHSRAVKQTRQKNFFSEELFARFIILDLSGTWQGNPVSLEGAIG